MTGTDAGVVIVGSGVAGATAAQTLRADGYDGPVTVVGAEPGLPFRRTALSKDLLAADLSPERIALQKPAFWAEKDIEIRGGTTVVDVDPAARSVRLSDGTALGYRALILATGGQPIRPDWLADDVPALRTVADAERIRGAIVESGSLVVIGGGLIGLELAASAAAAGHRVTVLEAGDRPMSRVVPPVLSGFLADLHAAHGVDLRLRSAVVRATAGEVELADGTVVHGTVIAALGMTPDVALAAAAGAEAGRGGVVVDPSLRTGVAGVYAAGDLAAVPDPRSGEPMRCEHWFGALDQGAAVARTVLADLAGTPAPVFAEVPRAWTVQYGVNVQLVGRPAGEGEVAVDGDLAPAADGRPSATVRVSGPEGLRGAVTVGRAAAARELRAEIAAVAAGAAV
ncbi:FAD-dependent oxidoreductase [Gordonia sp. PP30]|uniref:NAD(P)/FAD-dependent oxidoreductase n=1 Tax=unclassified Gordonia (in: high G+C Gram-positive bacteria) TaxID=2657482 RepID=UPI001FFED2D4|nr:FAD-dependent oxidoreductase [Gordonia sp. PP30]UQE74918.1 FAD-dependent oxidoreductase [Gordonia sp. PP30]